MSRVDELREQYRTLTKQQTSTTPKTSDKSVEALRAQYRNLTQPKQQTQQVQQQVKPATQNVVNTVAKNAVNAINTANAAYKNAVNAAAQKHGQVAKEAHTSKQTTNADQQVVNRLKAGETITDKEDIKAIARANGISEDEINYVMGKMEAQKEPMLMRKEDIYKVDDAESIRNRNPVLNYDKRYGTQEAKKEIQGLDFKNNSNGDKYLEYQEKLAEAKRNNDTRNIAKYSTLVQDFKEKYKENYTKDEEQERKDLQALYNNLRTKGPTAIYDYMQRDKDRLINTRDSLNQLYNDRNEILTRYAAATTPEEKQRIASEYYRIDDLIQEKRKTFGDLLAYDDTLNNNIIGDSASSFATQAVGGTANAINAGYSYGNKLIGNDLTTVNPDQLLAYNNGSGFNFNDATNLINQLNPITSTIQRVTGQGEGPQTAANHLARIAALYPNNARLQNLLQQIANRSYTGTREQLADELDSIQKELYQGFKDQYTQDDLNRVEEQLRHNEAVYGNAAFIPNAFGTVGNMLPSMALGYATGGVAELAGGGAMGATGTLANNAQQIGSFGALGLGAAGQSMDEALANGAKYNQAQAYGALSGATEVGTEMIGGETINSLFGRYGKSALGKVFGKAVDELNIENKVAKFLLNQAGQVGSEMTEEMISEALNPIWQAVTYNPDALPKNIDEIGDYLKNILKAGAEAIPSTLLMQGGGMVMQSRNVSTVENGIIDSINNNPELSQIVKNQLINEVRKASREVKLGLEEADHIETKANERSQQLAAQSNEMKSRIPEGYSLPQSTVDILAYTENNRPGLNIAFDTNIQGNGTFVENPDGTRTITLNPNSKRAVEFTLTHELGHDLKGTGEYTQLQNILTDYAKGKQGYQEALKSLDQTYRESGANYNLQDEATNDMLGQAIGEQEFLNSLAQEKPNLFERIYNWFKNVLFDSEKTGLTLDQRRLLNKMEQGFRNAYQSAYKGTNSQTQYSLPNNVKDIKNMNQFLRETIPLETNTYWKERLKDAQSAEDRILNKYSSPLKEKRKIVQQYLDYKNQNNPQYSLSEEKKPSSIFDSYEKYKDNRIGREKNKEATTQPRFGITKVRNGWNIDKIQKELKAMHSYSDVASMILAYDSAEELADNLYYHGANSVNSKLKAGSTINEENRNGGYGQDYHSISLSKSKEKASIFAGPMTGHGVVYPVVMRKNANVIEMPEIQDSIELEDILPELWEQGIDAVKIGDWDDDYSEQEIVVLNPRAIVTITDSPYVEYVEQYGKPKYQNLSLEELEELRQHYEQKLKNHYEEELTKRNTTAEYSKSNGQWQQFVQDNFNLTNGTRTNFLPSNEELQQQETDRISQDAQALNLQEPEVKLTESDDDTLFSLSEQEQKEVNNYIDQLFNDILLDDKFKNRIVERLNRVKDYNQFKQIKEDVRDYKRNNSPGLAVSKKDTKEVIEANLGKFARNSKVVNNVVNEINKGLEDGTLTDTKITELVDNLGDNYKVEDTVYYDAYSDLKHDIQKRTIYVPEEVKRGITDYNDFRKANMGNLKLTNDRTKGTGVDQIYQELQEMYPDMFPDDIYNPIDQLEHIADLAQGIRVNRTSARKELEKNYGYEAWDEVGSNLRQDLIALKDKAIYNEMSTIKEDMDEALELSDEQEEKIAELLREKPKQQGKTLKEKAEDVYKTLVNKGYYIDKLAEISGNKQLMYKYDKMLSSANEGNYVVGEKQTNNKGKIIGKSVNEIWKPVEDAGKVQEFSEYLLHKLNIDRMSLEDPDNLITAETNFSNFVTAHPEFTTMSSNKIKKLALEDTEQGNLAKQYLDLDNQVEIMENRKNKPVFGNTVTAEDSKRAVAEFEKNNPEFKEWAKDINTFNKNQLQNMVDAGLTSTETQDLLNSMYDNYIRIQREVGGDSPIVNQRGRLKVNSPIKKAKGGNQDILPLKDSMAQQALEVKKAIARNAFGLELLNTLQNGEEVQEYGDVLQEGKKGEAPTFTVFRGGQPITMKINTELYDAIKPSQRASWEDSIILNGLQKAVVLQKTLLTSRNPIFAFTNFVRDLQTAMVNSKSTTKMLKNYAKLAQYKFAEYFNNKANKFTDFINKKAGTQKLQNKELNSKYSQLADLWQLYKANGGESNTYFDFEKGTNLEPKNPVSRLKNKIVDKIFGVNEIIEQLPRVAEFVTTLEDGGTIEEAMYNAADVTVNFKRGGELTKFADRNGASFLNASIQGLDKQIRNFTKGGAKGFANALIKTALLGIAPQLLNHLLMGDDDDYEDLPDYIKDNYWLIKTGDNEFLRIPRGRDIPTFIGVLSQRTARALKGDEHAFDGLVDTFSNNLAPNNPLDSNIFSPITAMGTNKSWSGNDIVSSTLSDKEASEQYDAKDTEFAKWLAGTELGKKMELSPKKIDYLLDQYSGGIGDILIPMNTKYAERGNAFSSKFTTDSITNNKQLSRFYDDRTMLEKKKNSDNASDEQLYQYKYFTDVSKEINELNKQQREIQMSDLSDKEKISQVTELQKQVNALAKEANKNVKDYGKAANDYSYSIFDDLNNMEAYTDSFHVGEEGQADIKQQILTDGNLKAQEKLGFITDDDEFDENYSKKLNTLNTKLDKLEKADIPLADYYLTWYAQKNVSKKNAKQTAISQTIDSINEGDHQLSKEQKNVLYEIFNVK